MERVIQAAEIRHVLAHGLEAIGCGSLLVNAREAGREPVENASFSWRSQEFLQILEDRTSMFTKFWDTFGCLIHGLLFKLGITWLSV